MTISFKNCLLLDFGRVLREICKSANSTCRGNLSDFFSFCRTRIHLGSLTVQLTPAGTLKIMLKTEFKLNNMNIVASKLTTNLKLGMSDN